MATEPDFTIADVLAWARTKPADGYYPFEQASECALCIFLRDTGRADNPVVGPYVCEEFPASWNELGGPDHVFSLELDDALSARRVCGAREVRWTFGALVTRLEALCPETPVTASNWLSIDAYLVERVEA